MLRRCAPLAVLFLVLFLGLLFPDLAAAAVATTTALSVSPSGSVAFLQPVALTATITDASNNPVLHGSVTFFDGSSILGTATIISSSSAGFTPGTAIFRTRSFVQSSHSLTARFNGTVANSASTSTAVALTITAAAGPYTSVTQLASTGSTNGQYGLTATVGGLSPSTPTGSVTFNDTTAGTSLGTQPLTTGSAGFLASATSVNIGADPCSLAIAGDFNNDGILDVLTVGDAKAPGSCYYINTGTLTTLLGNPDGSFTPRSSQSLTNLSTGYLGPLAVADFNGDGNLDVVAAVQGGLLLYPGNGDGTFQSPITLVSNYQDGGSVATADFNGDGIPDIAYTVYPQDEGTVTILPGNGDGTFGPGESVNIPGSQNTSQIPYVIAGEINGDGNTDLLLVSDSLISLLLGNGDGTFQAGPYYLPSSYDQDANVSAGFVDLAKNGQQEIVWLRVGSGSIGGSINVLSYTAGAFSNTSYPLSGYNNSEPQSEATGSLAFGDFNYDGKTDVAVYNAIAGQLLVYAGNGDGTLQSTPAVQQLPGSPTTAEQMAAGDFLNNGSSQLLLFDTTNGNLDFLQPAATATAALSNVSVPQCGLQQVSGAYSGDTNFSASTSNSVALGQQNGSPTIAFSGVPAAIMTGTPFPVTVTITASCTGGANPTGTVQLQVNSATLAQGSLSGTPPAYTGTVNTQAQPIAVGPATIVAAYSGDTNWLPASPSVQVAIQGTTSSKISYSGPTTVPSGDQMNASGVVTANQPGSALTGTATLLDNGKAIYSYTPPAGSQSPLAIPFYLNSTTAPLATGTHVLSLTYGNDNYWSGSSSQSLTINVQPGDAISVASNLPGSQEAFLGAAVQFRVTVSGYGSGTATGTLQFYDGSSPIGAPVQLSNGAASFTSTTFAVGAHSVTAKYSGDTNYASLTLQPIAFTVVTHGTVTVTLSSLATVETGMNFDVQATINPSTAILGPLPSGTATLTINGSVGPTQTVGTNPSSSDSGVGFNLNSVTNNLPLGSNYFSATYSGDSNWGAAASNVTTVDIVQGPVATPTLSLASSLGGYGSVVQGTSVTFTATVTGSAGTPTGTVQFYLSGTALGGPVTLSSGVATYTTSALPPGTDTVTAAYSGSTSYSSATTNGVVTVVTQGPDTLAIALSSPSTVSLATPVTITGTVTVGALGPAPTGTVSLFDGNTSIASTALSGNAPAAVTFTVNTASQPLAPGAHTFGLKYAGSTQWAASTASAAPVTVTQAVTTTQLSSSAESVTAGASVTLTAAVASTVTSPAPTGTVQFVDGTTSLGTPVAVSGGSATYTTTTLSAGTHSITAVYSGDANFASSTSAALSESIEDFTLQTNATSATVAPGSSASFTLTVTSQGGLNSSIAFACAGLPADAACSFSPQTVTGTGTTSLTISTQGSQALAMPPRVGPWLVRAGTLLACVFWIAAPRRRRKAQLFLLVVIAALLPTIAIGCGGGSSGSGGSSGGGGGGTSAGTYTVTITASAGSGSSTLSQTTQVSLTVQ